MSTETKTLKRCCSKCNTPWKRTYLWAEAFPEDESDSLQVNEGCPNGCESCFLGVIGPNIDPGRAVGLEEIDRFLKRMGVQLSE